MRSVSPGSLEIHSQRSGDRQLVRRTPRFVLHMEFTGQNRVHYVRPGPERQSRVGRHGTLDDVRAAAHKHSSRPVTNSVRSPHKSAAGVASIAFRLEPHPLAEPIRPVRHQPASSSSSSSSLSTLSYLPLVSANQSSLLSRLLRERYDAEANL